jgi:subtilase family serine protease
MRQLIKTVSCLASALLIAGCGGNLRVASPTNAPLPVAGVPHTIDESRMVTLRGNVHPLARPDFDQGVVNPGTRLDRMLLLLKPSPARQAALDELVEQQQNPHSPLYHQWLTPAEFGARFGVDDPELEQVTAWLAVHGLTVEEIPAGQRLVVFSGTAGQVFDAFHTELHRYRVDGAAHIANAADPQIPSTLARVVAGVVSLHDFRRGSQIGTRTELAVQPQYSAGSTHYLFPADFATIYDLNPLYAAGTNGTGSSIAIAARSNIKLSDVAAFRSMAALPADDPAVILAGPDPGLVANDQDESTLDVEWSGAVAPAAAIDLVVAASRATTDGVDLAAAYIVNHATAPVVSVSYGSCEQEMGAAELAFYNSLWEQAASQGMSVFVASGDAGAAGCSAATDTAGTAAAVNGLCSSPFSTCVGGTEFNEGTNPAQYWSAANSASYASALGYIPEEVWNESALNGGAGLWASGGGASVVYAQPAWQADVNGAGAANGMRAVPDVALSAADHDGYFLFENNSYFIVSGTSVAAPSFAGVMALVVDSQHGVAQGNANPGLYSLVSSASNPFHPTPSGNNSVPGVAGFMANGAAYNPATGLGSVDGALLVKGWGADAETETPTLTLTASAQSVTLLQSGSAALGFTAATGGSFAGNIGFSVSGLPAGVAASWSANPLAPAASVTTNPVTLMLTASPGAAIGYFSFVVTAAGDGLTSSQRAIVLVQARTTGCSRFSLLPTRCKPPIRTPIRLSDSP